MARLPLRNAGWCLLIAVWAAAAAAAQSPRETFEAASVKSASEVKVPPPPPLLGGGQFHRTNDTVADLVQFAYGVMAFQVIGGPDWIRRDRFEINARAGRPVSVDQLRLMVQSLLKERFGLVVHSVQRKVPHFVLSLVSDDRSPGPGLRECTDPAKEPLARPLLVPRGHVPFVGHCHSVSLVAQGIARMLVSPVLDRTYLSGFWSYEVALEPPVPQQTGITSFATTLRDVLGFRLEYAAGPVEVIVVEAVTRPIEK